MSYRSLYALVPGSVRASAPQAAASYTSKSPLRPICVAGASIFALHRPLLHSVASNTPHPSKAAPFPYSTAPGYICEAAAMTVAGVVLTIVFGLLGVLGVPFRSRWH
ncbi:uncharacterized protein M437DRAFT_80921 [Aureobasidium melanogenum CBS 110374]|uniref:Uncharacterized protein n=1 Tax=Aureobasidium melanogenum (strain CBS 110374) TaxID=1043003 RepID=A0A074WVK7_AURM1|nr:uncharacterized protein M437DRAFT_80921 [Aureobasidium melanogenum CBS 110374]KEQ66431.1 hypothetical protein M437DRAFT_80921 [Aureobasidium melanogenum CBS 110374]